MASGFIGQLWHSRIATSASEKTSHRIEPTLGTPSVAGIQGSSSAYEPRLGLSVPLAVSKHHRNEGAMASDPAFQTQSFEPSSANSGQTPTSRTSATRPIGVDPVAGTRDVYARPMRQIEPVDEQQEIARVQASVVTNSAQNKLPRATAFDVADAADAQAMAPGYDQLQPQPMARELKGVPRVHGSYDAGANHTALNTVETLEKFAPETPETIDRGVFVETHSLGKFAYRFPVTPKWIAVTASAVVLFGAGWTFGSSVFSGDMSMGARDVITISHDLTNEKVIPAASEKGGYQVPNLDMQVLQRSASNASFFSTTRAAPDPEQPSLLSADEVASLSVAPKASRTTEAGLETPTTVADPVVPVTNALSAQSSQSSLPVSEALAEIASVEPTVAMSDNQETQVVAQAALQDDQPDLMVPKVDGLMTGTDNALQQPLQYGVQTPRTPGAMTAGALIQAGTLDAGLTYGTQPTALGGLYADQASAVMSFGPLAQDVIYPWGLQLGASYSHDDAQRLWQDLKQTNLRLLGSLNHRVEPVVQNTQSYYRLQVGPFMTRSAALDACAEMRASYIRVDCFPVTVGR